jgi:hypothetical protein
MTTAFRVPPPPPPTIGSLSSQIYDRPTSSTGSISRSSNLNTFSSSSGVSSYDTHRMGATYGTTGNYGTSGLGGYGTSYGATGNFGAPGNMPMYSKQVQISSPSVSSFQQHSATTTAATTKATNFFDLNSR